ncbi:MAG: hypothetical protein N3F10_07825, partial [Candidatus Bathyarchaeota archaeon]|nr:hypothetical protein [Candidatus Bathyarchaeota archaeon]
MGKSIKAFVIAFILMLTIASLLIEFPAAAQTQYTNMREGGSIPLPSGVTPDHRVRTVACLSFRPNPVGVGQPVLINAWLMPPPHVS